MKNKTKSVKEKWEEKEQLRVLSKCSPELREIIGRHSRLWNYSKLETVDKISELISLAKQEGRKQGIDFCAIDFELGKKEGIRLALEVVEKLKKSEPITFE